MRARSFIGVSLVTGLAVVALSGTSRATHSDPKPKTTPSWYMETANPTIFYDMGCDQANKVGDTQPKAGLVLMSFGDPALISTASIPWGASMYAGASATTAAIEGGSEQWGKGFWQCLTSAQRNDDAILYRLALGITNNYPASFTTTDIELRGCSGLRWSTTVTRGWRVTATRPR